MNRMFLLAAAVALPLETAHAAEITVYNQNLGLVEETRTFSLEPGENVVTAEDVAAQIDPTSVQIQPLAASGAARVLEQDFEYDLLSPDGLLDKYIGKTITLRRFAGPDGVKEESVTGILLSDSGGRILKVGDQILVDPPGDPVLSALPQGLALKPTLEWDMEAAKAGEQRFALSYLTSGMNWQADYALVVDPSDEKLDMDSWATVTNDSGATFKDATLRLVAGDIQRVEAARPGPRRFLAAAALGAAAPGITEQPFFEYHLYAVERPTTLRDRESKQIALASAADVPVVKRYVYDGGRGFWGYGDAPDTDIAYGGEGSKKVEVTLEFENSKENHLGLPLPKGRARVYQKSADGSLEFIGEDSLDHTPKDETVRLHVGDAFDIVGERERTSYESAVDRNRFTESFKITLRNHKDSDVVVTVVEHPYRWNNWKITESSLAWTKRDDHTIEFQVPVPKNGEASVDYTVKYSW